MAKVRISNVARFYPRRNVYSRAPRFWIYPQHSKKIAVKDSKLPKPATEFKKPYVADNLGRRSKPEYDKEPAPVNVRRTTSWEKR